MLRSRHSPRIAGLQPRITPHCRPPTWPSAAPATASQSKTGHHKIAFESVRLALGAAAGKHADYFETCRRKRNAIDYTHSHVATETEAKEILKKAAEFYDLIEAWIVKNHAPLKR
jgi:hypothetical protein